MSFPCSPIYFILYIEKYYSEVRFPSLQHKKVHQLCPREWWSHGEENHPQTSEMHNVWIPFQTFEFPASTSEKYLPTVLTHGPCGLVSYCSLAYLPQPVHHVSL